MNSELRTALIVVLVIILLGGIYIEWAIHAMTGFYVNPLRWAAFNIDYDLTH